MKRLLLLQGYWLIAMVTMLSVRADEEASNVAFGKLDLEMKRLATEGAIVGAQVAVRKGDEFLFSQNYGVVAADLERGVDEQTLFLIGSCSKPFASLCLLSLISDERFAIELDDEIDRWLPVFGTMTVKDGGKASHAPTVDELLSHRAGIYSQKVGMTGEQTKWIREFRYTLEESVTGISGSPLISQPGAAYAYSGAGYCVLGRVAELVAGQPFEAIFQERICRPLELSRTTFFPAGTFPDEEIARGAGRAKPPHRLGDEHRLPLIGGSLYSTAQEMTVFGEAIVADWSEPDDSGRLAIAPELLHELGKPRSAGSGYSLGWKVLRKNGKVARLSHSGSLQSYRALLSVDLETGVSVAICWTLGRGEQPSFSPLLRDLLGSFPKVVSERN